MLLALDVAGSRALSVKWILLADTIQHQRSVLSAAPQSKSTQLFDPERAALETELEYPPATCRPD